MEIAIFCIGTALSVFDLAWRLSLKQAAWMKRVERAAELGMARVQRAHLPLRLLTGACYLGAYGYARMGQFWLCLGLLVVFSAIFGFYRIFNPSTARQKAALEALCEMEDEEQTRLFKKQKLIGISCSALLLLLWIYAWEGAGIR